jgi:hypothetical protein
MLPAPGSDAAIRVTTTPMSATKQSELDQGQLRLLRVGDNEDSGFLRDLLSRTGDGHLLLDHARLRKRRWPA